MGHPKLYMASIVVVLALSSSSVAAADCPPAQISTGRLPIGSDLVINYTLPVNSQRSYVVFQPKWPFCDLYSWYILSANGNSMAGTCGVGLSLTGVAGSYTATVKAYFYGQENSIPVEYIVTVFQKNC